MKGQVYSTLSKRSFTLSLLFCALINSALTIIPFTSAGNNNGLKNKIGDNFELNFEGQSVLFCKIYDSSFNCQYCIRDYYLSNGVCVQIPYSNIIPNCNIYTDAATCKQCDASYYVNANNHCSLGSTALNCQLFASQNACLTCQSGFILSGTTCTQIQFCASIASTGSCANCISGYYLLNSACAPITSVITNCLYYSNATACQQCQTGYALFNSTYCALLTTGSGTDPNCSIFAYNGNSGCSLCREGYLLNSEGCVATIIGESCFLPNPDDTSKCIACMSGYQINSNNGCDLSIISNSAIKDPLSHPIINMMYILALVLLLKQ